jgi:hypothetical protein
MKTNSLIYRANKVANGVNTFVTIRLNDECKNGHQDFSITGEVYEAGKPKIDRNLISAGCCHDEILKAFPEFKIFVDLHLCDYLGNPMYATANGYYHLKNGFNNTQTNSKDFESKFCNYYRISKDDFKSLAKAESKTHYAILLLELNIPAKWKKQAEFAIKKLEQLTGNEFLIDSVKNNFGMPSDEELAAEKEKLNTGYYSQSAKETRHKEAVEKSINDLRQSANKAINAINTELNIKIELFKIGGKDLLDKAIYYTHRNEICFNWRGYGAKISQSEADEIMTTNEYLSGFKYEVK